jgi:endogenous inhibitor of DNA gyrase (YacG/DUF329 family)
MSCPICGEDAQRRYRPFCSKRCADIDLGKWLNEGYTIPETDLTGDEDHGKQTDSLPPARH